MKTPESHEFPLNLHPEWLRWEGKSCRLRDSVTTHQANKRAAGRGDRGCLVLGPKDTPEASEWVWDRAALCIIVAVMRNALLTLKKMVGDCFGWPVGPSLS